jgi:two-component system sensor histidine kinase UhpB
MSLFWRIFLLNAVVLVSPMAVLLIRPVTRSTPVLLTEAIILTVGVAAMLIANAILLRIGLAPLAKLTAPWPPSTCCAPATGRRSSAAPGSQT